MGNGDIPRKRCVLVAHANNEPLGTELFLTVKLGDRGDAPFSKEHPPVTSMQKCRLYNLENYLELSERIDI